MELIIIFATLALIGASIAFIGYRAATEVERTIRLAIEKGVLTNASLIPELREPAGLSWVERLTLLGMLILFASGGIVLVAIVLIVSRLDVGDESVDSVGDRVQNHGGFRRAVPRHEVTDVSQEIRWRSFDGAHNSSPSYGVRPPSIRPRALACSRQ